MEIYLGISLMANLLFMSLIYAEYKRGNQLDKALDDAIRDLTQMSGEYNAK